MMTGRWRRLAWAIALFALAGTPAARAYCAAACDASGGSTHAAHASPAAPVADPAHGHAPEHAHAQAGDTGLRLASIDPRACDDLIVAAVAGTRMSAAAPAPAAARAASPLPRPTVQRPPIVARTPLRPPGGAIAPLPLRI